MRNTVWKRCFTALGIIFCTVFLLSAPSWGADWAISPYVVIIEEYNNNILFSNNKEKFDDLVTRVRPRVQGTYETKRLDFSLDLGLEWEEYLDNNELDSIDHDYKTALSYALSRTFTVNTGAYFRMDTTLESELEEEGLLVPTREDRRRAGGNLGFVYAFSDRVSCSGDWRHQYIEYPDSLTSENDQASDSFSLTPHYVLSPRTTFFLTMAYSDTEYDKDGDGHTTISHYSIMPSFRYDFAEDFYVSGGAGYSHSHTEQELKNEDEKNEGFSFDLRYHRDWKTGSIELRASRDQYSTYYRRSSDRSTFTLRGTCRLSHRCTTSLNASYYMNRFGEGDDRDYFTVSPAFSYSLTRWVALRASVEYSENMYEDKSVSDRERFRARLDLNFAWPRLLSSH